MPSKGKSLVTMLSPAPVTVYNVVIKYCDQNQLREGRAHFSSQLQMIVYHQKKSGQELKEGSWSQEEAEAKAEGCFLLICSGCPLPPSRTSCPGVAPPAVGSTLPRHLPVKRMLHRLGYTPVL